MSGEGPKLFTSKPKKPKLKTSVPAAVTTASGASAPPLPAPPYPPPPSHWSRIRSFVRSFVWPLLLVGNFSLAAYVLMTRKNDPGSQESGTQGDSTAASDEIIPSTPNPPLVMEQHIQRAMVPEDQQRELFKWMLEEKRKVKPRDDEEKRRLDEEKAILKNFIRATSIVDL